MKRGIIGLGIFITISFAVVTIADIERFGDGIGWKRITSGVVELMYSTDTVRMGNASFNNISIAGTSNIIETDPITTVTLSNHTTQRDIHLKEVVPTQSVYSIIGTFTDLTSVSLLSHRDGKYLQIHETTNNPGFQAWWIFPGFTIPTQVVFRGCVYDGGNNHDAEAIIFNDASSKFYDLRLNAINASPSESDFQHVTFSDESIPYERTYDIPEPVADYVDELGNVLAGVWHPESGLGSHNWYCDSIHVEGY